jgi:hypothetical protein
MPGRSLRRDEQSDDWYQKKNANDAVVRSPFTNL